MDPAAEGGKSQSKREILMVFFPILRSFLASGLATRPGYIMDSKVAEGESLPETLTGSPQWINISTMQFASKKLFALLSHEITFKYSLRGFSQPATLS